MFKLVKKWLGTQSQPQQPVLGPSEKRVQDLLTLEQEMLERKEFVERQKKANKTAKELLCSLKAQGLLPHQVQKLEEEFLLEDEDFEAEFYRLLNGEEVEDKE